MTMERLARLVLREGHVPGAIGIRFRTDAVDLGGEHDGIQLAIGKVKQNQPLDRPQAVVYAFGDVGTYP